MVRATQNVFGGGVEEKVEGAKEEENKVGKGNLIFLSRDKLSCGFLEQLDSIPEEKEKSKSEVAGSSADRQDEDEEDEEEDDGDDAQIAYEWLEIARLLYSKNDDKTSKLREAESLSMLAELKTENDQLEDARSDYKAALEIFKAQLGKHDRKVATIYYQVTIKNFLNAIPDLNTFRSLVLLSYFYKCQMNQKNHLKQLLKLSKLIFRRRKIKLRMIRMEN